MKFEIRDLLVTALPMAGGGGCKRVTDDDDGCKRVTDDDDGCKRVTDDDDDDDPCPGVTIVGCPIITDEPEDPPGRRGTDGDDCKRGTDDDDREEDRDAKASFGARALEAHRQELRKRLTQLGVEA